MNVKSFRQRETRKAHHPVWCQVSHEKVPQLHGEVSEISAAQTPITVYCRSSLFFFFFSSGHKCLLFLVCMTQTHETWNHETLSLVVVFCHGLLYFQPVFSEEIQVFYHINSWVALLFSSRKAFFIFLDEAVIDFCFILS